MMRAQPELLRVSAANIPLSPPPSFSRRPKFPSRPTTNHSSLCSANRAWIAQLSEELAGNTAPLPEVGPIELRDSVSSFIAASDDPTLQTSAAILLTGAFTLFLFRSLRRRAKLAKQMRWRSTGANKSLKNEALESLRNVSNSAIKKRKSPPSADEAFVGALIAAAFGLLLYKFTTSVEYNLNQQVLSNNYSVRQITITIRTIINGICYLATFVFGFNSLGLFLYSGQLALNSFADVPTSEGETPINSLHSKSSDVNGPETTRTTDDRSSDKTQK